MKNINSESDGSVIGYMCAIDWECELGAASGGNVVYPSLSDLRNYHPTCDECGVVEVNIRFCREVIVGSGF